MRHVVIGAFAAMVTVASFVPQAVRTVRRRSARDLSWGWLLAFVTGLVLWTIDGVLTGNFPLIASNLAIFALIVPMIVVKARTERDQPQGPRP